VALAQETIIIGGSARPPVEVNLDVLDDPLGGSQAAPGQDGPIRLRPPGSAAPRATAPRGTTATAPRTAARSTTPPPLSANDRRALSPAQAAPPPSRAPQLNPPARPSTAAVAPPPAPRLERPTAPAPVTTQPLPAPSAPVLPPINLPQVATPQPAPAPAPAQAATARPVPQAIPPVIPPPTAPAPQVAAAPPAQAPAAAPIPAPAQVPAPAAAPRAQTPVAPPAPTPAPAPRAAPAAPPAQTAALPTVRLPDGTAQAARLSFQTGSSTVTPESERELRRLAQALSGNENRVQLRAYADGPDDRPSTARRLSLSRALAVRSFLIEAGLRSTRIDVRALGGPGDGGPVDRVDVILLTQ
jgi:outer membrane protein OmpA-like peptidoglycan-associated protein